MDLLILSLKYRLDVALVALLALLVARGCHAALRMRHAAVHKLPGYAWFVACGVLIFTGLLAEWTQRQRQQALISALSGFAPTYANELRKLGHEKLSLTTPPSDPGYLTIIAAEREWQRINPLVADIYTFRRDSDGKLRLLVDSETDYNHNDVIDEAREARTPIGEIYTSAAEGFHTALNGKPNFDLSIQNDRWGTWVSSFAPIYGADGNVEGGVGVDYPASDWLGTVAIYRSMVLGVGFFLISVCFAGTTVVTLLRSEILERKLAERQLAEAKEAADLASRAKSEFLAVMTHEIRTPLTAVMGFTSVLSETNLDRTQRRYLETIASAGERMTTMLNDILDLTKIEEGRLTLDSHPFQPRQVLDEVIDLMTPYALEKNLALKCEGQLPPNLIIEGDASRVRQVVLNIVSNGLKFTDRGSVSVKTAWAAPLASGNRGTLTIEVVDTGIGIESGKLKHLFETFSQAHGGTRRYNGKGLGLSICQRLVTLMGGSIRVQSLFSMGSTFTVEIPCMVSEANTAPALVLESAPAANDLPTSIKGRALVVDDQSLNRELLKVMLRRLGYAVETVESGEDAIRVVGKTKFDVVLMDLEMPGIDGYVTTRRIRAAEPLGQHVPILAVTATTTRGTRERCLEAGMDDYLTKPVYQPALVSALDALKLPKRASNPPITPGKTQTAAALA